MVSPLSESVHSRSVRGATRSPQVFSSFTCKPSCAFVCRMPTLFASALRSSNSFSSGTSPVAVALISSDSAPLMENCRVSSVCVSSTFCDGRGGALAATLITVSADCAGMVMGPVRSTNFNSSSTGGILSTLASFGRTSR